MTKLSLSPSLLLSTRGPASALALPVLAVALAACGTTVTGGPADDDAEPGAALAAACLPSCTSGGRVRAWTSEGFSAVVDLDVDARDGAVVAATVHENAEAPQLRAGARIARGMPSEEPAWQIDLGSVAPRIGVDPTDGTIAFAGEFTGAVDALGIATSSAELAAEAGLPPRTPGLLVARIAPDGTVLRARALSRDVAVHEVVTRGGRVALVGHAHGVGSASVDGRSDAYLAVFDDALELEHEEAFGGPGDDAATGITFRNDGAILVAGRLEESVALGGLAVEDGLLGPSAFAALLGPDLAPRAVALVDDAGLRRRGFETSGAAPILVPDGGAVVKITYDGGDPEMETGLDRWSHAITSIDDDLVVGGSTRLQVGADAAFGLVAREDGTYAIAGTVRGALTLDGATLAPRGELDGFAMVLDADGAPTWATRFGDEQIQTTGVAPTADGLVVGGVFWGGLAIGDDVATAGDDGSAFVLALPLP